MENNTKKMVAITTVIIITTILGGLEIMCIDAIGVDNILNTVKDPLKMTLYTGRVIKFLTLCVLTVCMIYIAYRLYEFFIDVYKFNSDIIQQKKAQKKVAQKKLFALVSLGLPSGTLWADRNLGANAPEQYGYYYRFGETVPFTEKSPEYVYDKIEGNIAGTDRDAATVNLGKNYRMPTFDQIKELLDECKWKWTKQHLFSRLGLSQLQQCHVLQCWFQRLLLVRLAQQRLQRSFPELLFGQLGLGRQRSRRLVIHSACNE